MEKKQIGGKDHEDGKEWLAKLDRNQIWIKVFHYLNNPSDLTSAYFTCEIFRKHADEKRTLLLLPKVFRILRENRYLEYRSCWGRKSHDKLQMNQDILRLRQVSKSFKSETEKEFLEHAFNTPDWYMRSPSCPIQVSFTEIKKVEEMNRILSSKYSSPSCFRSVSIFLWHHNDEDINRQKAISVEKAIQFLKMYGKSVWIFTYFYDRNFYEGKHYEHLVGMVNSMSSLRALALELNDTKYERASFSISKIIQHPFPSIPCLKKFQFGGYTENYEHLIAEILCKNPGIKSVSFTACTRLTNRLCLALSHLQLENFVLVFKKRYMEYKEELCKLTQFDWPLRKLCLANQGIDDFEGMSDCLASECNVVIRKFRNSLEEIFVDLEIVNDWRNQGLRVPNLKVLKGPKCHNLRLSSDVPNFQATTQYDYTLWE